MRTSRPATDNTSACFSLPTNNRLHCFCLILSRSHDRRDGLDNWYTHRHVPCVPEFQQSDVLLSQWLLIRIFFPASLEHGRVLTGSKQIEGKLACFRHVK